jgi:hypothetical protein
MGNAARTGVAAGENGDGDLVCVAKHFSMAGEDALEVADDFRIVAEVDGTFELQRDGGKVGAQPICRSRMRASWSCTRDGSALLCRRRGSACPAPSARAAGCRRRRR